MKTKSKKISFKVLSTVLYVISCIYFLIHGYVAFYGFLPHEIKRTARDIFGLEETSLLTLFPAHVLMIVSSVMMVVCFWKTLRKPCSLVFLIMPIVAYFSDSILSDHVESPAMTNCGAILCAVIYLASAIYAIVLCNRSVKQKNCG